MSGGRMAVALGFFDGVHRAHREVLSRARSVAGTLSMTAAAVTFDRHPAAVLAGEPERLVQTLDDRIAALRRDGGMDEVIVLPFTDALRTMPWQDFAEKVLLGRFGAGFVSVGYDYRFGYRGEGTAALLRETCRAEGIGCDVIPEIALDGRPVHSTGIRALLQAGDLDALEKLV